ncbi:hypothetical protein GIB67_038033 [Kingdonia uniflora]|uniref:KIB1-4 beta-propeller domain-containing protein n=1 Tax=Kingdonia uniflora TaxID=39325 RepID=A0A7J7MC97_9MAGN|nr:hypothetical protein GIB67_038033 [Kingdonia uniflora]
MAADWSQLPKDLLDLITKLLITASDNVRFCGVCSSWREVGVECRAYFPNQFPGLMVPGKDVTKRCFLECTPILSGVTLLSYQEVIKGEYEYTFKRQAKIPVPHEYVCRGSSQGWLVLTDDELYMHLLNPFSGAEIQLPSATTLPLPNTIYYKGNFYILCSTGKIVVCDIGGNRPRVRRFVPSVKWNSYYYFPRYIVESSGDLFQVLRRYKQHRRFLCGGADIDSDSDENDLFALFLSDSDADSDYGFPVADSEYISNEKKGSGDNEVDGGNESVEHKPNINNDYDVYTSTEEESSQDDEDENYGSSGTDSDPEDLTDTSFKVFKLEQCEKKWVRVDSLDDNTFFVGFSSSFSLPALDCFGCKPNCIYFTDDSIKGDEDKLFYSGLGNDNGAFNLAEKSLEANPIISGLAPSYTKPIPMWLARIPW